MNFLKFICACLLIILILSCNPAGNSGDVSDGDGSSENPGSDSESESGTGSESVSEILNIFPAIAVTSITQAIPGAVASAIPGAIPSAIPSYLKPKRQAESTYDYTSRISDLTSILENSTTVEECLLHFQHNVEFAQGLDCFGNVFMVRYDENGADFPMQSPGGGPYQCTSDDPLTWANLDDDMAWVAFASESEARTNGAGCRTNAMSTGGVFFANEGTSDDDEACMVAKMNFEVRGVASKVDMAMNILYSTLCAYIIDTDTEADDFIDGEYDLLTDNISAYFSTDEDNDLASASLTVAGDNTTFEAAGSVSMLSKSAELDTQFYFKLENTWLDSEKTSSSGRAYGYFTVNTGEEYKFAWSAGYALESDSVNYELRQGFGDADSTTTDLFDDGEYIYQQVTGEASSMDIYYMRILLNPETNDGSMKFIQQKSNDTRAGIFEAKMEDYSGFAYFGFHDESMIGADDLYFPIDGFYCNLGMPGTNSLQEDLVQAQSFALQDTGIYIPLDNRFFHMPTNSCDYTVPDDNYLELLPEVFYGPIAAVGDLDYTVYNSAEAFGCGDSSTEIEHCLLSYPADDSDTTYKTIPEIPVPVN
ncbi:MAG: hypothetical protein ABII27_05100 [bacterium]